MNTTVNEVVDTLYQAAADVEKQDRESATLKLISIKGIVANYIQTAGKYQKESERSQRDTNKIVSELILQKSKIHDDCNAAEKKLQDINTNKNTIKQSLRILTQDKATYQSKKEAYQKKLTAAIANRNKDLSPGDIAALVFTLGLYYIKIDKDIKDAERDIRDADDHIRQYSDKIIKLTTNLRKYSEEISRCSDDIDRKKAEIRRLSFSEFSLHNQEIIARRKGVYFTQVSMFCSRVQRLLDNIDTHINYAQDLVEELNNQTPTIESLAYSGYERITLKEAILTFGNYIDANIPLRSFDSGLIENQSYYIANEQKGVNYVLTYTDNVAKNIVIAAKGLNTGQLWKFTTRDNGKYNLTVTTGNGEKYLTRTGDGQLIAAPGDGSRQEQCWTIEQENGSFRLRTDREPEKSLEYSFRTEDKPRFFDSEDIGYQRWTFLPDIPANEQPLSIPQGADSKITFKIQPVMDSTMCLDVYGNKSENGSNIIVYDFLDGNNQKWQLLDAEEGYYYLEAQHAQGKVLDVCGNGTANGTKIIIQQKNDGDNQKWKIIRSMLNSNIFILSPKNAPNSCLDLSGEESYNETDVILYSRKSHMVNKNQLWIFSKV